MASESNALSVSARPVEGSRATRRLRRQGLVPGVIYGGGEDPRPFAVDGRILRTALAHSGAVVEVSVDGGQPQPVIVKDVQHHPVRGETIHVDFLRVRMDQPISASVTLELVGAEDAPGVSEGGILTQEVRELTIEALPGDIPDSIVHDVSDLEMNATVTLAAVTAPAGVTLLDDLEETVIATITPPTLEPVEEEIETETELVGEEEQAAGAADAQAAGDTAEEAEQKAQAADEG